MTTTSPLHGTTLLLVYVDDMIITSDDGLKFLMIPLVVICHKPNASDLLACTDLTNCKATSTLVDPQNHLTPLDRDLLSNSTLYFQLYMLAPHTPHYTALRHILPYLKGTMFHGLHYSTHSFLELRAFFDVDWVGDLTDRRSATHFCFFSGDYLLTWRNKKQSLTARSSTEAGYRALTDTT
ncbi:uncharacterized protein LOC114261893 [Camellia sinensis]|uniref:uncharacterized protein LOC114261893 n=1 Tax=Camellia sinensis TaxID=4442 RepID=UPI00103663E0|nr:uncharacterized protein LOC114261893 [Camellia sinensis]